MKYALTLTLLCALAFSMVTQSFRAQSTAGLWADDYDLLFDPARITEIEGSRLWTNLSNFMTSYEDVFNNGSVPFILLGGTTRLSSVFPALIYDRSQLKFALPTGLDDVNGDEIIGDAKVTTIDWIDSDNNGTFDRRIVTERTASAYNYENQNDFYLAAAKVFGNKRFGLGFMHNEWKYIFTNPANNFTFDTTDYNLVSGLTTFQAHAGFAGDNQANWINNGLTFSAWLDQERVRFGLQADLAMIKMKDYALINGDTAVHTNPADTSVFHTTVHVLDSLDTPQSGMDINVTLKSHYNYSENAQGRFYLNVGTASWDYGDGALDFHRNGRLDAYTDFLWDTTNVWTWYTGSYSNKRIGIGTRQLFTVSPRLKFGIGLFFTTGSWKDSTVARDTTLAVEIYDDNDGISFDPDDYVETSWSSESWMTKRTGATHEISIPVGLEFTIANPVVFRLGAEHQYTIDDYTVVQQQIAYEPLRIRTVDGTGAVDETMIDPGPAPIGSDETHLEKTPRTNYYYGIGWNATDNLQIDLMGFAKLTDLTNWKLSATLKF